jgi:hypothetical protein
MSWFGHVHHGYSFEAGWIARQLLDVGGGANETQVQKALSFNNDLVKALVIFEGSCAVT